MKLIRLVTLSATLACLAVPAFAGLIQANPSGKILENVALIKDAQVQSTDGKTLLAQTNVGASLRTKKLGGIIPIKVYVGQLLVANANAFDRSEAADANSVKALDSLKSQSSVTMQLQFLIKAPINDVVDSFMASAESNGLQADDATLKPILEFLKTGGDIPNKGTLVFAGETAADGSEHITVENPDGKLLSFAADAGAIRKMMSLWLGTLPAKDSLLQKFKKEVTSGEKL